MRHFTFKILNQDKSTEHVTITALSFLKARKQIQEQFIELYEPIDVVLLCEKQSEIKK
jgi:hypothetical protein